MSVGQVIPFRSDQSNRAAGSLPAFARQETGFQQLACPLPGQVITCDVTRNTYTIGNRISEGFFAVVYECYDQWGNELVAKVLKGLDAADESLMAKRALDEFDKLKLVRHPNVTYIYDAFKFEGRYFLITERCDSTLSSLMSPEFNMSIWFMPIARCILQAVDFIHQNGLVHKDLHADNIYLDFQKDELLPNEHTFLSFKIGDLGIANFSHNIRPESTLLAGWMLPPEAIDGGQFGPMDHRIDIYHCGLLFLQLLLGRKVYFTKEQILNGEPREMALALPTPYSMAIEKSLRRRTFFRTYSANEFWRDLKSPVGLS